MATILPETPMVNLGSLYINGLIISVDATTPLSVIDVKLVNVVTAPTLMTSSLILCK